MDRPDAPPRPLNGAMLARRGTSHMATDIAFNAIFWTLLAVMLSTRTWFQFRVWRTGERLGADRAALQREGLGARVVAWVFHLLLAAVVLLWFQGNSLANLAFPAPPWSRWAGLGLGITSVALFAWTHA